MSGGSVGCLECSPPAVAARWRATAARSAEVLTTASHMLGRDRGAALGGTDAVRHRGGREAGECDDLVGPGALKRDSSQFLQSMMLGLGAWLAIRVEVTPRIIIAASILLGRALASIDQAVGQWPLLQRALEGRRSLDAW